MIVGVTDKGKSSVLRALKWLSLNAIGGDAFITRGKEFTRVELKFGDDIITRYRGRRGNRYELNGEKYVSFGRGKVPNDIAVRLNLSSLSFQGQHDPPYLLGLPPGEVSRELNRVVNLDLIDRTLAKAAAQVRSTQTEELVCRERLESAQGKLGKLGWVKKAVKLWGEIEGLRMEAAEHTRKASLAASILTDVGRAAERVDLLSNAILGAKTAVEAGEAALKQRERIERIHYYVDKLGKVSEERNKAIPDIKAVLELERLHAAAVKQRERADRARELLGELQRVEKEREEVETELKRLHELLEKELKGKVCPVCGNLGGKT